MFYLSTDGKVMAVPVSIAPAFRRTGAPVALFTAPFYRSGITRRWDATADGQKFLITTVQTEAVSEPITVVLNWPGLLRK